MARDSAKAFGREGSARITNYVATVARDCIRVVTISAILCTDIQCSSMDWYGKFLAYFPYVGRIVLIGTRLLADGATGVKARCYRVRTALRLQLFSFAQL